MKTLVLDTNIVSYLMKGHSLVEEYRHMLEGNLLIISFMTVAELYEGAFRAKWGYAKRNWLETIIKKYVIIPSSPAICSVWAEVRYGRRTQPISSEDAWIAATAVASDCPLVTHNAADFVNIPRLELLTANRVP